MKRLRVNAELYARHHIVPLALTIVLALGGTGLAVSGIPLDVIKAKALDTFIMVAQAMTKTDPRQQSNELIKMEGRRRKTDWKETHEIMAWNHRMMEEGRLGKPKPLDYVVKAQVKPQRKRRVDGLLVEAEHTIQLVTVGITLATIVFSYYVTQHFLAELGRDVVRYVMNHGA